MAITGIGDQKTPGRPVEIVFDANTGLPSANQELLLLGRMGATGGVSTSGSSTPYTVVTVSNVADLTAATAEANAKFGLGSELAKMVIAAVAANSGGATFPAIKCVPIALGVTDYGPADAALVAARNTKAEFVVVPYDGQTQALRDKLKAHCLLVSGAQRPDNNQFGTVGVMGNMSVSDASTLFKADTQFLSLQWFRDTTGANPYSLGELSAACAAEMASNAVPFNPLDNVTVNGVTPSTLLSDAISVGAGLESEVALNQGWTPLSAKADGTVRFVRTVTSRVTIDGTTAATAYYDVQDFQVLYLWRKTIWTRSNQPDFRQVKASVEVARNLKSELIRLAQTFEDQNMFQAVAQLAKQFIVERSLSDRHRFDVYTPVNVIPGLHVIASRVAAGTQFDTFSV